MTVKDATDAMFEAITQKSKELEKYLTSPPKPVKFEEGFISSVSCEYCFEKEEKK